MTNKFFNQQKNQMWFIVLFLVVNFFVFRTAIESALFSAQLLVVVTMLIAYFVVSFLPFLLSKGKQGLILLVILISFSIGIDRLDLFLHSVSQPIPSKKLEDAMFLSKEIHSINEFKMKEFCFPILFPTHFPTTRFQIKFRTAVASLNECNTQIVVLGFVGGDITIIEIPKNYNYSYRRGFEDLEGLKTKALVGEKIPVNKGEIYLQTLDSASEGFPIFLGGAVNVKYRLLFWQTHTTSIFVRFSSKKFNPYDGFDDNEIVKMVESMHPIN